MDYNSGDRGACDVDKGTHDIIRGLRMAVREERRRAAGKKMDIAPLRNGEKCKKEVQSCREQTVGFRLPWRPDRRAGGGAPFGCSVVRAP